MKYMKNTNRDRSSILFRPDGFSEYLAKPIGIPPPLHKSGIGRVWVQDA